MVVVAILVIACFVLFMPSARSARRVRALASLRKSHWEYTPAELKPLEQAHWITANNNFQPIRSDEAGILLVWAPTYMSTSFMNDFCDPAFVSSSGLPFKKALLIAPSDGYPALVLFGKVCMSTYYQRKNYTSLVSLASVLEQNAPMAMPALESAWNRTPRALQVKIDRELEENRRVAAQLTFRYGLFQTGEGHFFGFGFSSPQEFQEVSDSFNFLPAAK